MLADIVNVTAYILGVMPFLQTGFSFPDNLVLL